MNDKKTIAIFGAGTGLGASLAKRFGREGYRVALVARRAGALEELVAQLVREGVEAQAFVSDLTEIAGIPGLVRSIEERLGPIGAAVYAPVSSHIGFVPAIDLDAAKLGAMADILMYSPVEVSKAVLPGMLARGSGSIFLVGGLTALATIPGMSGVGPLMAATRNYALTLNAELADKGVYAGTVSIGAMISRSAGMRLLTESGASLDPRFPVIDPDDIAEEIWTRATRRDKAETILPPLQAA